MQASGLVLFSATSTERTTPIKSVRMSTTDQRGVKRVGTSRYALEGRSGLWIPVAKVLTSEYFGPATAWLAFGEYGKTQILMPHEDYNEEQMAVMKKTVTPYLSTKPDTDGNLVIVAHDDPFEAYRYYPSL